MLILLVIVGILISACAAADFPESSEIQGESLGTYGSGSNDSNREVYKSAGPNEDAPVDAVSALSDTEITPAELEGVLFMREEEKLARDVYLQLAEQWGMNIFSNIASSEATHMDAVLSLIDLFGAEDPVQNNSLGAFANQDLQSLYDGLLTTGNASLADALIVGGAVEESDILDLQKYLEGTANSAVIMVYQNLLMGSINHLASFARTYERQTGQAYQPQYLSQDAFTELISQSGSAGRGGGQGYGMNDASQGRGQNH